MDHYTRVAIEVSKLPIKLTWSQVNFSVTVEQKKDGKKVKSELQILKQNTGYAMPGTTTFIMGASGSGKTSLLNILSDRVSLRGGRSVSGNIVFNDKIPAT